MRPPPPLDIVEGEERYEVKEVINGWFYYWKLEFLVKWKGYGYEENSWISERDIDTLALIASVRKYGCMNWKKTKTELNWNTAQFSM